MEVKNKYAYVIMQDIWNTFLEVNFLGDVWFLGQIVYSKIEHPSIINKIVFLRELKSPEFRLESNQDHLNSKNGFNYTI